MKKIDITYDELVVGLILKFGSIDVNDISVLMDMMGIEKFSSVNESGIGKYIRRGIDNRFEFNMDMVKRNYERVDDFYLVVQTFQGNIVKKFLENIDLFEFVLKKIKNLGNINLDSYDSCFSNIQRFVISELKNQGYLNDDCNTTMLTVRGYLYLFLIDNKDIVDRFSKKLRENGYNEVLLQAYLVSQKLDMGNECIEKNIMNIDHFLEFCDVYGIDPYAVDLHCKGSGCVYGRVRVPQKIM